MHSRHEELPCRAAMQSCHAEPPCRAAMQSHHLLAPYVLLGCQKVEYPTNWANVKMTKMYTPGTLKTQRRYFTK